MPNEIRPCTLWGETFDACDVKAINDYFTFEEESASFSMGYNCGVNVRNDPFRGDIASPTYKIKSESYQAIIEAITTIAEALNAPVLVTQAVLDAMEKVPEARFFIDNGEQKEKVNEWHFAFFDVDEEGGDIFIPIAGKKVIADCPLSLQVLLQFTLDGVRIREGG